MIWFLVGVVVGAIAGVFAALERFRRRGKALLNAIVAHAQAEQDARNLDILLRHAGEVRAKHLKNVGASHGAN